MSDFRYWRHEGTGSLYVLRPLRGENPRAWRARQMRQTLTSSGTPVTIRLPTLEPFESVGFILLDDLAPEYRDVIDEN